MVIYTSYASTTFQQLAWLLRTAVGEGHLGEKISCSPAIARPTQPRTPRIQNLTKPLDYSRQFISSASPSLPPDHHRCPSQSREALGRVLTCDTMDSDMDPPAPPSSAPTVKIDLQEVRTQSVGVPAEVLCTGKEAPPRVGGNGCQHPAHRGNFRIQT